MAETLVHVKGLSDLVKFLETLAPKLEQNVARGAMRAGALAVLPTLKANVHSVSGKLAASFKVRTEAKNGVVMARLYSRDPIAHLVEWGTKPHTITAKDRKGLAVGGFFYQTVQHPGARPRSYARNAMDTQSAAAVVAVGNYVKNRLATKQGLDTADITIEADE